MKNPSFTTLKDGLRLLVFVFFTAVIICIILSAFLAIKGRYIFQMSPQAKKNVYIPVAEKDWKR